MWPTTGRHSHSLKSKTTNATERSTLSTAQQSAPPRRKRRGSSATLSAMVSRRMGQSVNVHSQRSTALSCSQPRLQLSKLTSPPRRPQQRRMGHTRLMDLVSSVQLMGPGSLLREVPHMSQSAPWAGPAPCSSLSSGCAHKEDVTRTMTPGGLSDYMTYCVF